MYDFSKVAPATVGNYLDPGIYKVRVKEAKAIESSKNKTPGLTITFHNQEGQTVAPTFYVTENTLDRLQYLYTGFFGKNIDANFKNAKELLDFFVKAFTATSAKKITKILLVSGNVSENGRVFSDVPYAGFFVEDENVELGEFDKDSKEYKKYVTPSNLTNEASGKKNGILNDTEEEEEDDDFGKGKKENKTKSEKTPTSTKKGGSTKAKGKKEEPEEESEEEDNAGGDDEPEEDDLKW